MASRADGPDDDAVDRDAEPAAADSHGPPEPALPVEPQRSREPGEHDPSHASEHDPGPTDDERWAAIVAQLGDLDPGPDRSAEPDGPGHGRPGPADGHAGAYPVAPWVRDPRIVRRATGGAPSGRDWDGTGQIDDAEAEVDAEEHFVPPDPGPVLGGDPLLTMAWLAVVTMPLFLFVVLLVWRTAPSALVTSAFAVLFLGAGVLLWRMPHRRDDDDTGDDTGAVV